MGYVIRMPQMGMTMDEGVVVEWLIEEGSTVSEDDPVVLVESEKTTMDVEARESGTVARIMVQEGRTVEPGEPIGILTGEGETADDFEVDLEDASASSTTQTEKSPVDEDSPDRIRATPGARKLAEERGVGLVGIDGTGPQGVIIESDVPQSPAPKGETTRTVTERGPLSSTQQTIADRLAHSQRTTVPVTINRTFDAGVLQRIQTTASDQGISISLTDLLIKATARALREHPQFNAIFQDEELELIGEVNLCLAVDVDRGLVTPVLPKVTDQDIEDVAEQRRALTDRVQSGNFTMDLLSGGTFTISNLGPLGVDHFDPVINPPQVGILGVGRIRGDDSMTISLTFDHRVVNGADAARFVGTIVDTATDPDALAEFFAGDLTIVDGRERETREVTVNSPTGFAGTYSVAGMTVQFDEPTDMGGSGQAPTPVEHLLGALGSCLALSVRAMADRDEVSVDEIGTSVAGTPTSGPLDSVSVQLSIESDAPSDAIDRVVTKAERACYVERALDADIDVTVSWERRSN